MKKFILWGAAPLLLSGLTGCYYPVYPAAPYVPVAPAGAVAGNGPDCRPYTQSSNIDGKTQPISGTACLQPDGSWKDAASGAPVDMPPAPPAPQYAPAPQAYYAAPAYYPAPAYYAPPPYAYAYGPDVAVGGFYVGGGGYRHWH